MKKMIMRKGIAILLSLVLVLGCALSYDPISARADGNNTVVTINASGTGADLIGDVRMAISDDQTWHWNPGSGTVTVNSSDSFTITVEAAPGCIVNSASLNGSAMTLTDGKYVTSGVSLTGATAALTIEVNITVDNSYTNILWGYDQQEMDADNYVDPRTGTIEIVKIVRNGSTIFQYNDNNYPMPEVDDRPGRITHRYSRNDGTLNVSQDIGGGGEILSWYLEARQGDVVTFQFIPKPGYQLKSASINNYTLIPQNDPCTYEVTMAGLLHLSGAFVRKDNQAAVTSNTVTGAAVTGNGGVDHGTLAMNVSDLNNMPDDNTLAQAMGNDSDAFISSVANVNITMANIISKGGTASYAANANNYWATNESQLGSPVDISLSVPASDLAAGETYSIVRNHGGQRQELNAVYNSTTGKLTFSSDQFSEYTIIKKAGTPVTTPEPAASSSSDSGSSAPDPEEIAKGEVASSLSTGFTPSGSKTMDLNVKVESAPQGPKAWASINYAVDNILGKNYEVFATYNMLDKDKLYIDKKTGSLTLGIPGELQKLGGNFAIIVLQPDGKPVIYRDTDNNPNTATFKLNCAGYAFALCYLKGGKTAGSTLGGNGTYTIRSGDTLSGIAARLGVNMYELAAKNGIKNVDRIVAGMTLVY